MQNSTNEVSLMDLTLIHFLTISDWPCVSLKKTLLFRNILFSLMVKFDSYFNPWIKCYPFGRSPILLLSFHNFFSYPCSSLH